VRKTSFVVTKTILLLLVGVFFLHIRAVSDKLDITHVARLARLKISEDEVAEYTPQLETILSYIDTLNELDVEGIEPSAHAKPVFAEPREDIAGTSMAVESLEQNAPAFAQEQIKVPRVVES